MARKLTGSMVPCETCGRQSYIYASEMNNRQMHFCTRACQTKWKQTHGKQINQHLQRRIQKVCAFCKGQFQCHAYRKDTARFCSISCKGKSVPEDKHSSWKGDGVGYQGVHHWVRKHKGPASGQKCAFCGKPAKHWANIDGRYKRDTKDYIALCISCHWRHDNGARGHGSKLGGGSIERRYAA